MLRVLTCFFFFLTFVCSCLNGRFLTQEYFGQMCTHQCLSEGHIKSYSLLFRHIYFLMPAYQRNLLAAEPPLIKETYSGNSIFYCVYHPLHYISERFCLSLLGRGRRVGVFVSIGGTGILFHLLVTASKETVPSEELMLQLHLLLAKVGPKGRRTASHVNSCTHQPAGF